MTDILDDLALMRNTCVKALRPPLEVIDALASRAIGEIIALRARRDDLLRSNIAFEERARKAERATKRHEKAIATLMMQYLDLLADGQPPLIARPLEEYHEDMGAVLWWKFPITEPPYVGSPLDLGFVVEARVSLATSEMPRAQAGYEPAVSRARVGGWPGYHTHFTPIPVPNAPEKSAT